MNILRIIAMVAVVIAALIGTLLVLNIVSAPEARDAALKSLGVVLIIGIASGAIGLLRQK